MSTMPMPPHQRRGFGTAFDDILSGVSLPRIDVVGGLNLPQAAGPMGAPAMPPSGGGFQPPTSEMPSAPKMSKGQMILGILGDALAGAAGRAPAFGQMMQKQKEQERVMAQWGLKRQAEREDKQWEWQNKPQDPAPALRDAQAWAMMTAEQRTAYQEMKQAGAGDPDVFVTLPNGQVYAGPKSGLSQALTGGAPAPAKPVGKLTPIPGGPASAPGGFRP